MVDDFANAIDNGRQRECLEGDALGVTQTDGCAANEVVGGRVALACEFVEPVEDGDGGVIAALSDVEADYPFGGGGGWQIRANYHSDSMSSVRQARMAASSKRAPSAERNSQP